MVKGQVVIRKVWRSELAQMLIFLVLSGLCVYLSKTFPGSVMTGEIVSLGSRTLYLSLPLFWLLPLCWLIWLVARIYNVRYTVDSRGIEARVGILSLNQRIIRVRYEDIRSVETAQSLVQRMLDIGNVEIGTAATGAVEIVFQGIAAPTEVQEMIQSERDRRQKSPKRLFTAEAGGSS